MTPQAIGELIDELEELGYVVRRPDPTRPDTNDRRAKRLIVLTERGHQCVTAGRETIEVIEERLTEILGTEGHRRLRALLTTVLDVGGGG